MGKKTFIAWVIFIPFILAIVVYIFILLFVLIPILKTPTWINLGGLLIGLFTGLILMTWVFPFILIVQEDTLTFIGFPWTFKINRGTISKVVIRNYGFYFLPKTNKEYRWLYTYHEGNQKGYKFLGFWNLHGWGAIIEYFKPINPGSVIEWEFLKANEQKYIEDILYS